MPTLAPTAVGIAGDVHFGRQTAKDEIGEPARCVLLS